MRSYITKILIKLAMKTCVYGFTYDALQEAYWAEDDLDDPWKGLLGEDKNG